MVAGPGGMDDLLSWGAGFTPGTVEHMTVSAPGPGGFSMPDMFGPGGVGFDAGQFSGIGGYGPSFGMGSGLLQPKMPSGGAGATRSYP